MAPIEKIDSARSSHMTQLDPSRATFSNFSTSMEISLSTEHELGHEQARLGAAVGLNVDELPLRDELLLEVLHAAVLAAFRLVDGDGEPHRGLFASVEEVHVDPVAPL